VAAQAMVVKIKHFCTRINFFAQIKAEASSFTPSPEPCALFVLLSALYLRSLFFKCIDLCVFDFVHSF